MGNNLQIGLFTLILILIFILQWLIFIGMKKTEINTCEELKSQSETLEKFWVTQWQKDMCDHYGYKFAGTKQAPVSSATVDKFEFGVWYVSEGVRQWQLESIKIKN